MSKDRAVPFSRKHRRYWITVTGGMLLIGAINVTLGLCSYRSPTTPARIDLGLGGRDPDLFPPSSLPTAVVRAFTARYPRTIAQGFTRDGDRYVISLPRGAALHRVTFTANGAFVGAD